jgi:hypothetical protein
MLLDCQNKIELKLSALLPPLCYQVETNNFYHQDDVPSAPLSPPEIHRALATTTPPYDLPVNSITKTTLPDTDENELGCVSLINMLHYIFHHQQYIIHMLR